MAQIDTCSPYVPRTCPVRAPYVHTKNWPYLGPDSLKCDHGGTLSPCVPIPGLGVFHHSEWPKRIPASLCPGILILPIIHSNLPNQDLDNRLQRYSSVTSLIHNLAKDPENPLTTQRD